MQNTRRRLFHMLWGKHIVSKIVISLMVAMMLPVAATPLSARACILSNVASEKACKPACCANKTCCATSSKNTAPPSQPVAKADSSQQLSATCFAVALPFSNYETGHEQFRFRATAPSASSPPQLALLCTFLIWSKNADARGVPTSRHIWSSTVLLDQWKQFTFYHLIYF